MFDHDTQGHANKGAQQLAVHRLCDFSNNNPLFISVYLLSSSHNIEELDEYFDHRWASCESLSIKSFIIVIGMLIVTWGTP